jgi:transposase
MSQRFRCCSLDQPFLMPPALQDWLPEGHLARFIAQVVDALDLSKILSHYSRKDGRGKLGYHPVMMVRLLLYGYTVGVRSSRKIERATWEDVAFRYLAADQHPDHDSLAEFRKIHLESLSGLFLQALRLCQKAGLVQLGQIAIDGTKVAANASRQQSRSYKRLGEKEQALAAEVQRLLEEAAAIDRQEDERFGKGQRGDELPEELATTERQLAKIRAAKQDLEREAQEKAQQAAREKAEQNGKPTDEAQKKRWQRAKSGVPAAATNGNLTDPESRLMKDGSNKAFVQAYNAQVAAAGETQVIVAQAVVQEPNDRQQLSPMVDQVQQNLGALPELTTADAGYWNEARIATQQEQGRDVLVPPDGPQAARRGQLPGNAPQGPRAQLMRQRLAHPEERKRYQKRNSIVEPVFGWIKEILGYRRFLLRGLRKVRGEWALICTVLNIRKLFRYGSSDRRWLDPEPAVSLG